MENASKALLIAGAVLIAIMLISLAILVFNRFGSKAKEAAIMDEQEIKLFNSKITPYLGEKISGSQVNALIQYVISVDTNAVSTQNKSKAIQIKFTYKAGASANTIQVTGEGDSMTLSGLEDTKPRKVLTGHYYKVKGEHDDNGLLTKITVEPND